MTVELPPTERGADRSPRSTIATIAARLDADPRYTGRGVTLAFLDSGFFAHPDLVEKRDRILAYHDLLAPRRTRKALSSLDASSVHGMMTSVVAAGAGAYPGLASDADLVLVKVGSARRIVHDDIRRGIAWVVARAQKHKTRVINISCGGDFEASYLHDGLSRAAEDAVRAGIVVVAAVGNAGASPRPIVIPPASAPSVIAVGGIDDGGSGSEPPGPYHSSYGPTIDGLQKPDLVAPAIWIAGPAVPDRGAEVKYQPVDGTSFAAPIVSSVVAQMLEANPLLTPAAVRRILMTTAEPVPGIARDRQGFGLIRPRAAVEAALAS